jgi:hypothetical protein
MSGPSGGQRAVGSLVAAAVASDDATARLVAAGLRRGRTVARCKNEGGNRNREEGNRAAGHGVLRLTRQGGKQLFVRSVLAAIVGFRAES